MNTPPDFRTLTDADWARELPRARAQRNEVLSEIRQRLTKMTTTHETTVERVGMDMPITLTFEWSRDKSELAFGPMIWFRDSLVARDANGREVELDRWERDSFTDKYARELP